MARLFLIRHGQPSQSWGGAASDPGLSELGLTQAAGAAEALAELGPLALVSSPMRRCIETATPFAQKRGVEPMIEPRVSEVAAPSGTENRGAWLQARFPWRDESQARTWPSLEPELQHWRREMLAYVSAIERDTAVFTHFIAINVIVGAALECDQTIACKPGHASITEIEVRGRRLKLTALGDEMQIDDVR